MNNLDIVVIVLVLSGFSVWFLAMLLPFSCIYIMDGAFKVEKKICFSNMKALPNGADVTKTRK